MSSQQHAVARSLDVISNDLGITDSSSAARVFEASLGAGTTQVIRAAGGISLRNASDEQIADAVHKVRQVSRDAGLSAERGIVHAAMAGGGFEAGAAASRRGAQELRASHETAVAYERQASSSHSDAQALRNAASVVTRDGFSITGDDTYAIHRRADAEGVSRSSMNDPSVMMDVARRHFLEKFGSALGTPLSDLDPNGTVLPASRPSAPAFPDEEPVSPGTVLGRASSERAKVSDAQRRGGVTEEAAPALRDTAGHFVETRRRVHTDIEHQKRRVDADEEKLGGERERRYRESSPFNNSNPGGNPELEPPLTTQWEFYTGGTEKPTDRP